jgi:3-hydroxyisobutyrate dehydrogenase-like beta-hydroxyacid dehydrogenase
MSTVAKNELRIGLLGFGEAGLRFAQDFATAGLDNVAVYSPSAAKATPGDPIHARALEAKATLVATPRALCERSDLIIGLTPGKAALAAVRSLRPYLRPDQLYVDASTAAVKTMEQAAGLLQGKAAFVDAAIMGPVPLQGIAVPIVASGAHAGKFRELTTPYGMNINVVSDRPGAASAMKLIRSVTMKGLAALLLESLEAAERYGVLDAVAADTTAFMDERPFEQILKRFVCGTAVHAERRIHEMSESLELLRACGASTRMTRATRAMLVEIVEMQLREQFGGREPDSIAPVLAAIVSARKSKRSNSKSKKGEHHDA